MLVVDYLSLDFFFAFLLFFANTPFLFSIVLILYYSFDKNKTEFLAVIMTFVMIFNQFIKSKFQIPLNPELLSHGWAYPSGHTHMNIVFWGMLVFLTRKIWLVPVAFVALTSSFFGMVHFRFHTWEDIYGGICFGMSTILIFTMLYNRLKNRFLTFSAIVFSTYLLIYLFGLPEMSKGYYGWLWNGFAIITAITVTHFVINSAKGFLELSYRNYGLLYAIIALCIGFSLNYVLPTSKQYIYIYLRTFSLITVVLLVTPVLGNIILPFLKVKKSYMKLTRRKHS